MHMFLIGLFLAQKSHSQTCHRFILFKVENCFKMSNWKVLRAFQSLNYWHFPQNVLLVSCKPQKLVNVFA